MCKEIHLDAYLAHRTLIRTSGIWNFKSLQSEFFTLKHNVKLKWHLRGLRLILSEKLSEKLRLRESLVLESLFLEQITCSDNRQVSYLL